MRDPLTPPPSLPEEEQILRATEDKQELERRRLLAQVSAPPADDDDNDAGPSRTGRGAAEAPSAPVIDEEEEYMAQFLGSAANESLPEYQR